MYIFLIFICVYILYTILYTGESRTGWTGPTRATRRTSTGRSRSSTRSQAASSSGSIRVFSGIGHVQGVSYFFPDQLLISWLHYQKSLVRNISIIGLSSLAPICRSSLPSCLLNDSYFSLDTLYGVGILNEPHICGYQSGASLWPACIDDYYPRGHQRSCTYLRG